MLSYGFTLRYDDPLSQYLPKNLEGLSCFYRSNCIWEAVLVSEQAWHSLRLAGPDSRSVLGLLVMPVDAISSNS